MGELATPRSGAEQPPPAGPPRLGDGDFRQVLDLLPAAVYITDPSGRITYYNEAAAALWGCRPALGDGRWCGSWKLYRPDGSPLPHDQCPMAVALREHRSIDGAEAIAERPDGVRVPFLAYPKLLHDASGALIGAVNMLVETGDRQRAQEYEQRLASIVESSDDAIVSKDLNGVITSWNRGAARLFGYSAEEAVGRPITMLIPADRQHEEPLILARIRQGEKIDHYETLRRRKDGTLIDISLTVSPLRDEAGRVVGVSKIARDITDRKRAEERQRLLLREMHHRVKNLFAVSSGVVALSARFAGSPQELANVVRRRLAALAQAHALTLPQAPEDAGGPRQATTLHALIDTILRPYRGSADAARVTVSGPDATLAGSAVTGFALLLHELATNAAKYGALSIPEGMVEIACADRGGEIVLAWTERGGPPVGPAGAEGFGTRLGQATVRDQLGGSIAWDWRPEGVMVRLRVPRDRLAG